MGFLDCYLKFSKKLSQKENIGFNILHFFNSFRINNVCICCVLIVFSFFLIPQAHSAQNQWGYKEVLFSSQVKKIVEKIKKSGKALDQQKTIAYMYELKAEVEKYIGKKIKIDKCFDEIEKRLAQRGTKLTKSQSKKLRKIIKNETVCHKNGKEDDDEPSMPLTVVVGVTMALCGLFLVFVPIPVCQTAGAYLLEGGSMLAIEGTVWKLQDDQEKDGK